MAPLDSSLLHLHKMVPQQHKSKDQQPPSSSKHSQVRQHLWSRELKLQWTPEHQGFQRGPPNILNNQRVVLRHKAGLLVMQQPQGVPSNQILRSGRGNPRAFRIGMKRRKTIGGEEIGGGEEEEEVVGEDLEEGIVATAEEEEIEGETEATEEEIEEEMIGSMMIGEMIESMKIGVIGHEEGTEVAVRTEDEVVIEAVEALREEELAKEAEVKMGTVNRKHIIKTSALNHSEPTLGIRTMLIF